MVALCGWVIHCGSAAQRPFRWHTSRVMFLLVFLLCLIAQLLPLESSYEFELSLRVLVALLIGGFVGGRVSQSRYFWPLVVVASGADIASVTFDGGFTQGVITAVSAEPNLRHPLLVYVPGPNGVPMPLLGLADLAFLSLWIEAGIALDLPRRRIVIGSWLGVLVGLATVVSAQVAMPLLPFLGLGLGLSLGSLVKPKGAELLQSFAFFGLLMMGWYVLG